MFCFEEYPDLLPIRLRSHLSKLRLCSIKLAIETGRYGNNAIDRNRHFCSLCGLPEIEDVYHCVIVCPAYDHLRKMYLKHVYYVRPSVYKFVELTKSDSKLEILKLATYIVNAIQLRKLLLNKYCITTDCIFNSLLHMTVV